MSLRVESPTWYLSMTGVRHRSLGRTCGSSRMHIHTRQIHLKLAVLAVLAVPAVGHNTTIQTLIVKCKGLRKWQSRWPLTNLSAKSLVFVYGSPQFSTALHLFASGALQDARAGLAAARGALACAAFELFFNLRRRVGRVGCDFTQPLSLLFPDSPSTLPLTTPPSTSATTHRSELPHAVCVTDPAGGQERVNQTTTSIETSPT